MDGTCSRGCRPRTRYIAQLDISPEGVSGFRFAASSHGSGLFAPGVMCALQKYKVKKIDQFSVKVTNSFLGERVGNKKLQLKNMKTLRRISKNRAFIRVRILAVVLLILAAITLAFLTVSPRATAQRPARAQPLTPKFSQAVAFDVSPPLRSLPRVRGSNDRSSHHQVTRPGRDGVGRAHRPFLIVLARSLA